MLEWGRLECGRLEWGRLGMWCVCVSPWPCATVVPRIDGVGLVGLRQLALVDVGLGGAVWDGIVRQTLAQATF